MHKLIIMSKDRNIFKWCLNHWFNTRTQNQSHVFKLLNILDEVPNENSYGNPNKAKKKTQ